MDNSEPTAEPVSGKSGKSGIGALVPENCRRFVPPRIQSAFGALRLIMSQEWSISAWRQPIFDEVEGLYADNKDTSTKVETILSDFFAYLASRKITRLTDITDDVVPQWCEELGWNNHRQESYNPAPSTMSDRRWVARVALTAASLLGVPIDAAALVRGAVIAHDGKRKTRVLSDTELQQVRVHASPRAVPSLQAVAAAVSLCGARPKECAQVTFGDVDLAAGTVTVGAGKRRRTNPLGEWPRDTIERRLRLYPPASPSERLCVQPTTAPEIAEPSIRGQLAYVIKRAGLANLEGVSALSLCFTAARMEFDAHGIEAAARYLGLRSLDSAAAAVGHEWRRDG